ncbi:hypothetical protein B9Z55_002654 [Caenorhabditis nigoni]|uniref:Fork-head domain-containing protein n=1 Tax=Caenorhabditis nigoni TaxID=1611254 RepID=A0A2G5VLI7_9PELO|nr:hypothetical protein B9Z55_002654 [Caenorhabditis nigoni]
MNDSLDDDFPPEPRGRCYTWPMQQFVFQDPSTLPQHHPHNPYHPMHPHQLPHMHHTLPQPLLNLNMTTLTSSGSSVASSIGGGAQGSPGAAATAQPGCSSSNVIAVAATASSQPQTVGQMLAASVPCSSGMTLGMSLNLSQGGGPMPAKKKRCRKKPTDQLAQKKPNPWGEESYSDIIAKALESAPDGRLKLNEIYQWFSDNILYFRERSSQEEAAGWKVRDICMSLTLFLVLFMSVLRRKGILSKGNIL